MHAQLFKSSLAFALLIVTAVFLSNDIALCGVASEQLEAQEHQQAESLLLQLDDPDGVVRKSAALRLNSLGPGALEVVEKALGRDDLPAETRERLARALSLIRPRAAVLRAARRRLAWEVQVLYDACSNQDDARISPGNRALIDRYVALGGEPWNAPQEQRDALLGDIKNHLDDPFLRFLYCVITGKPTAFHEGGVVDEGLTGSHGNIEAGKFSPVIKIFASTAFLKVSKGGYGVSPLDMMGRDIAAAAALPNLPPGELDQLMDRFYSAQLGLQLRQPNVDAIIKAFEKAEPNGAGPRIERARFIMDIALFERRFHEGNGEFNDQESKEFTDRFNTADALLEEAWKLDPTSSQACRLRVFSANVRRGFQMGGGTREEMELWFKRTMQIDPDNFVVCRDKMNYLAQEAGGDTAPMIDFGRELLKNGNWRGGLPYLLVDAHERLANKSPDVQQYLAGSEVWQDISEVYEGALLSFPEDTKRRSEFAKYATRCNHWDVADRQFKRLGEQPDMTVFVSKSSYDYLRRKAARLAATQPAAAP